MIAVRDLRVDYDDVCAVRNLTLSIPAGEIYGLIGPNGAGKTTTLRALMGLLEPTYGDILLNGIDLSTQREAAIRHVGFMPDFAPLYDDLMVWEFLDLFAASYEIPPRARPAAIDKYLARVDLTEKRTAMTGGLSRGMKQRLILAKTLVAEPKIILLDEPASGLDPTARALLRNILKELGAEGRTVVISSHILLELSEFCTAVGIMEKGNLVVSGKVSEVTERVLGKMALTLEVRAGGDICAQRLAQTTGVSDVVQLENGFTCAFAGDDDDASALLADLVTHGVRVSAFGRKKEDLEEVFMKIGAKEVS